jgi:hypothetical protein
MKTKEILKRLRACAESIEWAEEHPDPAEAWASAMPEWQDWLLDRIGHPLWAEYKAKSETLWTEYEAKREPLVAEYEAKREPLWAEYKAKLASLSGAPLVAEYEAKIAPLWAEYDAKRDALRWAELEALVNVAK